MTDATESLRMYGNIPDARNAEFNIWRTYDQDLTISDVSFYVRLNHSRLVTSKLKWRPELKSDIIVSHDFTKVHIINIMTTTPDTPSAFTRFNDRLIACIILFF